MPQLAHLHSAWGDADVLSAKVLQKVPDNELVSFLFASYRALRVAVPPFDVDSEFVKALLNPRILRSQIADAPQLVGCLLCDIVRLSNPTGVSTVKLPFPHTLCDDVLHCLVQPFEELKKSGGSLQRCEHLIERASASHMFLHLLPHCHSPGRSHMLNALFTSIQCTGRTCTGEAPTTSTVVSEMVGIVNDILNASNAITREQLAPLVLEVVHASPTLHPTGGVKPTRSPGALIAAGVFRAQVDLLQTAVASLALSEVERGTLDVCAAEVDAAGEEARRRGLRAIARGMEMLVAMIELDMKLVSELLPQLQPYMEHEQLYVCLLTIRGVCTAYLSSEAVINAYPATFSALIARFQDTRPTIRTELVQFAGKVMSKAAGAWSAASRDHIWSVLQLPMERRLVDTNVAVRRQAIQTFCEVVAAAPSLMSSAALAQTLGCRTGDKQRTVRQTAVKSLAVLYRSQPFGWIPNSILNSLRAEGCEREVEVVMEDLLPPPTHLLNSPSRLDGMPARTEPRAKWPARQQIVAFDFELDEQHRGRSYVDAFVELCASLDAWQYTQLTVIARKKPQLRLTIYRLCELRASMRDKDPKSPEGQQLVHNLHRLLVFLQTMTYAEKGEWETLFRTKDDTVFKAFLQACGSSVLEHHDARTRLLETLKGRIDGDVFRYVDRVLVRLMMLPLQLEHLNELKGRLTETATRCLRDHSDVKLTEPIVREVTGSLRALLVFGSTSSPFLLRCVKVWSDLLEVLMNASCVSVHQWADWILLILDGMRTWASTASKHPSQNAANEAGVTPESGRALLVLLERLCLGNLPDFDPIAMKDPSVVVLTGRVAKAAVRCLLLLVKIPNFCVSDLTKDLTQRVCDCVQGRGVQLHGKLVGHLCALRALAQDDTVESLVRKETLTDNLVTIMHVALQDNTDPGEHVRLTHASKDSIKIPCSTAVAVVDGCAKALSAIALSHPVECRASAVSNAMDRLLQAYKVTYEQGSTSTGACHRRVALQKQMAKILIHPMADVTRELAAVVVLSMEHTLPVRRCVQQHLVHHLLQKNGDARYASLLLMTAVSEESKSSYNELRLLVQSVGDHLRSKQMAQATPLSSPAALHCYLEYAVPFLIFFMAHHTSYEMERAMNHFTAFQRVWHLLFEELFRPGTQCAGFLMELFSRIKQSEDVLDHTSVSARTVCDLGTRVMLECLGQRHTNVGAVKRYPGSILLPKLFSKASGTDQQGVLETVFLDSRVHIATHVPFRAPAAACARDSSQQSTPRQVSLAPSYITSEDDEKDVSQCRKSGSSPGVKRGRVDSVRSQTDSVSPRSVMHSVVDTVLKDVLHGLTKNDIALLRWKTVWKRVESALQRSAFTGSQRGDVGLEDAQEYTKEQLKLRYEQARV